MARIGPPTTARIVTQRRHGINTIYSTVKTRYMEVSRLGITNVPTFLLRTIHSVPAHLLILPSPQICFGVVLQLLGVQKCWSLWEYLGCCGGGRLDLEPPTTALIAVSYYASRMTEKTNEAFRFELSFR